MLGCAGGGERTATMSPLTDSDESKPRLFLYVTRTAIGLTTDGLTIDKTTSAFLNLNGDKQTYTMTDLNDDDGLIIAEKKYALSSLNVVITGDKILVKMSSKNEEGLEGVNYFNGEYKYIDSFYKKGYRKKSESGDSEAQKMLGICYERGEGVPKNVILAYKWYELSASQGNQEASKAKEALSVKMTPAEITEAQRLSKEWTPTKGKE